MLRWNHKVGILSALALLSITLLLGSCAAVKEGAAVLPGEQDQLASLHRLWEELGEATNSADTRRFTALLTQESADWLDTLVEGIERMPEEAIRARPFHEAFLVLGSRFLFRNQELESYHYDNVIAATLKERPLHGLFSRGEFGNFWFENEEAWRGLARAGSVPLFFFRKENGRWRLDLIRTLPVVMRGLEAVGVKKNLAPADAVIYILDLHLRYSADASLLQP